MSLNCERSAAALFFLILLIVCSSIVSAQDKDWRQISPSEFQFETSEVGTQTIGESDSGEIFNRHNPEDSSSKRLDMGDKPDVFEREINEIGEFKLNADAFAAPPIKFGIGLDRFRESPIDVRAENSRSIFESGVSAEDVSRFFRSGVNLNFKFFSSNQTTSAFDKDENIRPKTPNGNSHHRDKVEADTDAKLMDESFRWSSAVRQSLMFLAVQHSYAFTQPKTREALKGNFFKDYVKSVKSLRGWADGGRFFTNYIAHPMQGSFTGFIQIQNDPKGLKQQFGGSRDYWNSRLKALAWSAVWSTQFEIGPVSQASIGNVGLKGKQTYVDIVVTPTVGTILLVSEDAIDRFIMKNIERRTGNFYAIIFSRMLLNPTRTIANLFRFKTPWYRDRPRAK